MKKIILSLILGLCTLGAQAQVFEIAMPGDRYLASEAATYQSPGSLSPGMAGGATENVLVANNFWSNWFVQMGLDMTLQNPYGYDFSKVFPNGKSFGLTWR